MVLGLRLKMGEFFRPITSSVGVSGIIPCTGSSILLVVGGGTCCGMSPTEAHHIPQVSQGGCLAAEVMAGGGDLRIRFAAKPGLVVWQAAAMGSAVSRSNFCVGLMSDGYTMGWFGHTILTILMATGGC